MATSISYLEQQLANPNIQAALKTIRMCEGTGADDGYQYLFGCSSLHKETFNDFRTHPNIKVTKTSNGKPIVSSAAGAYQILFSTFVELCTDYGFTDFTPHTQDLMCCAIFDSINVLDAVAEGRILQDTVMSKLSRQWASLPYAPYGQPTKQMSEVREYYTAAGGSIVKVG